MFLSTPKPHREHSLSYLISGVGVCIGERPRLVCVHTQPVCPALGAAGANWASPAAGKQGMGMVWEPKEESAFLGQFLHS